MDKERENTAVENKAKGSRVTLLVILIFIVGVVVVPGVIWFWPTPYYQPLRFGFDDVDVNLGITFQSNGPFAAGNPFSAYAVLLQGFRLPWNVSAFSVYIYGGNASLGYPIVIGPIPIKFYAWNRTPDPTPSDLNFYAQPTGQNSAGQITFYSSGDMRLLTLLVLTDEAGNNFRDIPNTRINGTLTYPAHTIFISSSDAQYSLITLKVLALTIVVGGMLTGYFPTVDLFGNRWNKLNATQRLCVVSSTAVVGAAILATEVPTILMITGVPYRLVLVGWDVPNAIIQLIVFAGLVVAVVLIYLRQRRT